MKKIIIIDGGPRKTFNTASMLTMKHIALSLCLSLSFFCSCHSNATKSDITEDLALKGVSNYCHSAYDWSIAEDNPSIMNVTMGEASETEYQVIFRSYTGALVYFYVDKKSGTTRMVECVPNLGIENEAGTIELSDYLENTDAKNLPTQNN